MKQEMIANRYADALFVLGGETQHVEQFGDELAALDNLLKNELELKRLLFHPIVAPNDKKSMLQTLLSGKVSPLCLNFILLLVDKKRIRLLPEIHQQYQILLNLHHHRVVAQVTTAIDLDGEMQRELRDRLQAYLNKQVHLETRVDPAVIGGISLQIGDRLIDATIKSKFETLARSLS